VDNAVGQLAQDGLLGVADFFVSGKYDTPMRQMHWGRRFFWRWAVAVRSIHHLVAADVLSVKQAC
jgi:anti-sigma-K factor RskA